MLIGLLEVLTLMLYYPITQVVLSLFSFFLCFFIQNTFFLKLNIFSDANNDVIKSAEGGLILKFDETTSALYMYRLCESKVYVSSYGKNKYVNVKRSFSQNGSNPYIVFDFHRFLAKLQAGKSYQGKLKIWFI